MFSRNFPPAYYLKTRRYPIFSRTLTLKRPSIVSSAPKHTSWIFHSSKEVFTDQTQSSWNVTTISATVGAALLGSFVFYCLVLPSFQVVPIQIQEDQKLAPRRFPVMAGSNLPGRPGNLTPEQEAKLQEMWTAVLKVFGVPNLVNGINGGGDKRDGILRAENKVLASAIQSEKKTKKRVSLFGRKNHDGEDDSDASTGMEGDDKYGQTKEFKKVLETQSPEMLRRAFWSMVKHDDPDALLLRFLRARKWEVDKALVMLVATMNWRMTEVHVDDDIMKRGEGGADEDSKSSVAAVKKEGTDFLAQMRLGKSFLHGTDKMGRPMCLVRVRLHKQGEQTESSLERYTVYTIETARHLLSANVDTAAIVFDMTNFSMANMDYAPVKFMIKCFEANYPESLGVVLVHNSPWIFHSIWKIIRGWLDPVVASKVHFTKGVEGLQEFVDREHIPKELGGDEAWSYHYIEPVPGENALLADETERQKLLDDRAAVVRSYETTTQRWIKDTQSRALHLQQRNELAERLRVNYWELDPYIRARSLYDRVGVIGKGGKVQFYGNESTTSDTRSRKDEASKQTTPLPVHIEGIEDLD